MVVSGELAVSQASCSERDVLVFVVEYMVAFLEIEFLVLEYDLKDFFE